MTEQPKKILIFDLDGTLIDSVPDIAIGVNNAFQQLYKTSFNETKIRNWVGNGSVKLIERALIATLENDSALLEQPSSEKSSNEQLEQAHELFLQEYAKTNAKSTKPYEDVLTGLKSLNEHFTLALITNKPMQFVPDILDKFGWSELFKIVLGGDSLEQKKPHPMPLNHVCEKLGFHVEQSFMIGDSKNDILAGQNANMETIGLSYGYNYGQAIREMNPTHAFDDFGTMVDFLLDLK